MFDDCLVVGVASDALELALECDLTVSGDCVWGTELVGAAEFLFSLVSKLMAIIILCNSGGTSSRNVAS